MSVDNLDCLIDHINARVGDPLLAVEAATWVEPMPMVGLPATEEQARDSERALGFPIPLLLRRLYLEVANGGFGPKYGVESTEMIVKLYERYSHINPTEPNWQWPHGLVPLISGGCLYFECVYFTIPPHAVVLFDGNDYDRDKPLVYSLRSISPSLESRLEAWLANINPWPKVDVK
jgi:hypothetical protein